MQNRFAVNKMIVDFDVMIEVDANTTIYGFAKFGTKGTNVKGWAILKEVVNGNKITRKWADGDKDNYDHILDNYDLENYYFLK